MDRRHSHRRPSRAGPKAHPVQPEAARPGRFRGL